jgi:hypothetical protein
MATPIATGDLVRIVKGCEARKLAKGVRAVVAEAILLGPEYGYSVKLVLRPVTGGLRGCTQAWYARHTNRLIDPVVNLNDGNPLHTVKVERCEPAVVVVR